MNLLDMSKHASEELKKAETEELKRAQTELNHKIIEFVKWGLNELGIDVDTPGAHTIGCSDNNVAVDGIRFTAELGWGGHGVLQQVSVCDICGVTYTQNVFELHHIFENKTNKLANGGHWPYQCKREEPSPSLSLGEQLANLIVEIARNE